MTTQIMTVNRAARHHIFPPITRHVTSFRPLWRGNVSDFR